MRRRAMPRLIVAALAAALVLAGCAGIPNPLATPVPPDALHPNQPRPAVAAPTPEPPPELVTELQRQRAIWDAAGIDDYRLQAIFGCECALGGKTVDLTIRNGQV